MFCFTRLPQELIDSILDFLIDDSQSLKASSLVCRSFLRRTRVHLFRQLHFDNFRHFHKFHNMCMESPHIPPRVETLVLGSGGDIRKIRGTKHFVAVMSLFTQLRTIELVDIDWLLLPQGRAGGPFFPCLPVHQVSLCNRYQLFRLVLPRFRVSCQPSHPRATPHRCRWKSRARRSVCAKCNESDCP